MTHQTLDVGIRTVIGNSLRKLRKEGLVPGIIYGNGVENIKVQFPVGIFLKVYKNTGKTTVVDLVSEGNKKLPCLVYDLDIHPVTGTVRHVDFLAVNLLEKTIATVPISFVGEPSKEVDGVVIKQINELEVEALPDNIPHQIEVDLSKLQNIGDVINVGDLPTSDKYTIINESDLAITMFNEIEEEKEEAVVVADPAIAAQTAPAEESKS